MISYFDNYRDVLAAFLSETEFCARKIYNVA